MNIRCLMLIAVVLAGCAPKTRISGFEGKQLITGKSIPATMPVVRQAVGSLPMNCVLTADRRYAVISDMGYRQSLSLIDVKTGKRLDAIEYKHPKAHPHHGLYYGLAISPDNVIYAASGAEGSIDVIQIKGDGKLQELREIKTQPGDFAAGVALDDRGLLFVTSNEPRDSAIVPLDSPGTLTCYDPKNGGVLGRFEFPSYMRTTNYPLAVAALHDGSKVYVASQRDGCVYVINSKDPTHLTQLSTIPTGAHPADLLFDASQKRLFVSNADSDTVCQIDPKTDKIIATVLLRPEIARDVAAVSPLGMSLAPNDKTLYVACGDLNAVAVLEMDEQDQEHELRGYLPAGWYPSAVATDGKQLLIVDAKGATARYPNPPADGQGKQPRAGKNQVSPNNLVEGDVLSRPVPTREELKKSTPQALELAKLTPRYLRRENPLANVGTKHVIYIVKENRTYDQVLGDLPQGNGDPSRLLFGRNVTPNLHALAERFVLFDNFYDCGEVSGDGWTWSTQAMANEYVIKNVPYQYSGRGRVFDYEGTNNGYPTGGFPARGPDGEPMSEQVILKQTGGQPVPDVAAGPGGHLWDLCAKNHISFRNYGFFLADGEKSKDGTKLTPDNFPTVPGLQPAGHDLDGVSDYDFRRFDLDYADSDAPNDFFKQTGDKNLLRPHAEFGKHHAPSRFSEWYTEFKEMLAKQPDGDAVPQMMFVRFGDDHTKGMSGGEHTPSSMVTDNDYACGQLVEAISHSPIWKSTAIFIIEDDAQNGPDHVDAHRSTCYVISPWVKKSIVDHTFHNTVSCIRTMELLLNLPPMNGYDATADPMLIWDKAPTNDAVFQTTLPDPKILAAKNPKANAQETPSPETRRMIRESDGWNFALADKAPAEKLDEVIWYSVKGNVPMPPTPHGPEMNGQRPPDDDDD